MLTRLKTKKDIEIRQICPSKIQLFQIYSMTMAAVSHSDENCHVILGEFMDRLGKATTSTLFNLVPRSVLSEFELIYIDPIYLV